MSTHTSSEHRVAPTGRGELSSEQADTPLCYRVPALRALIAIEEMRIAHLDAAAENADQGTPEFSALIDRLMAASARLTLLRELLAIVCERRAACAARASLTF